MSKSGSVLGVGLMTALASSLCCITPLVAIFAGSSSLASNFSWIEPLRPWLIGITILALGLAWYLQLKPQPVDDCGCEVAKPSFVKGKAFLGIVTAFAIVMLAFPYYSNALYPDSGRGSATLEVPERVEYVQFEVEGMTCTGCEGHVEHAVSELQGIVEVDASFADGHAIVKYDPTRTDLESIREAIESTSYAVGESKEVEPTVLQ